MAYYIFLKSLRSLEEFRKILMSKFLLNLVLQISKALVNSKIQFLIRKFIFPDFRPGRPRGPLGLWPSPPTSRIAPRMPKAPGRPVQPARRSRLHGKYVFLFRSRLPEPAASCLCHRHAGPACRLHRLHRAGQLLSGFSPRHRCPLPQMPPSVYSPPSSLPPLNPLQTER
jgi:hypothetical protein